MIHFITEYVYAFIDNVLIFYIGMLFLTRKIHLFSKNVWIPAVIYSAVYFFMLINHVSKPTISTICLFILSPLLFFIYLPSNRKWFWVAFLGAIIVGIMAEFSVLTALTAIFDISFSEIKNDPLTSLLAGSALVFKGFTAWFMLKYDWVLFRKGDHSETRNLSFWLFSFIGMIVLIYTLFFVTLGLIMDKQLLVMLSGFTFAMMIGIAFMFYFRKQEERSEMIALQKLQLDQVSSLFQTLRNERHDMVNHVQTVYGFIQAKQIEHAMDYLKTLVGDIKMLDEVMVKDNPALSSLLQVKMAECTRMGIDFQTQIGYGMIDVNWKTTEMNVVIGNIINNAIEAFGQVGEGLVVGQRQIRFRTSIVDGGTVRMEIWNNGPVISSEQMQNIMNSGYTTKKKHSGIGLTSVQAILEKMHSKFTVESSQELGTAFAVEFYGVSQRTIDSLA